MKAILLFLMLSSTFCFGQNVFQKSFSFAGFTGISEADAAQQTSDNGYIVTGITQQIPGGSGYVFLCKTDSAGNLIWTKTYGETTGWDGGNSVKQTNDGGYIVTSYASQQILLLKTDIVGDTLWSKTYSGFQDEEGKFVNQTSDGGYIIGGTTQSFGSGSADMFLIKTDSIGDTLWTKCYGTYQFGMGANYDYLHCMQQTFDGGYIFGGVRMLYSSSEQAGYLIKTDSMGNLLWNKIYGSSDGHYHNIISIQQTPDSGFILADYSYGTSDMIKTDVNGNILWSKYFFINGGMNAIIQTNDSGYAFAGGNTLIKTNLFGDTLWMKSYGGFNPDCHLNTTSLIKSNDGGYLMTYSLWNNTLGTGNAYLIKADTIGNSTCNDVPLAIISDTVIISIIDSNTIVSNANPDVLSPSIIVGIPFVLLTNCLPLSLTEIAAPFSISILPNPAHQSVLLSAQNLQGRKVKIKIADILGQLLSSKEENTFVNGSLSSNINVESIAKGIYFVSVSDGERNVVRKLIVE